MSLKKLISILFLLVISEVTLNAVTYEPLPNRPYWRGFYYCLDMADYPYLLQSNMPYEVLIGYIVADSIMQAMPESLTPVWYFIKDMNISSDTAQYLYKYWYYMNDYDPMRFWSFLNRKYHPEAKGRQRMLYAEMRQRFYVDQKFTYVVPSYILHIYVNNVVWIDVSDTKHPTSSSSTIAYCQVLDTLKGKMFPSLDGDNAIFYNGSLENNFGIVNDYAINPLQTDIVFSFRNNWTRGQEGRSIGKNWIKSDREYIVFLEFGGEDAVGEWDPVGSLHKQYYTLFPYPHTKSCSMYPVEDGYVLDEKNAMGFGTKVPVETFKQNIRDQINLIKNYGE